MDRDVAIYLAREAGFDGDLIDEWDHEFELLCRLVLSTQKVLIREAVKREREQCALDCEQAGMQGYGTLAAAALLRKRGQSERPA